MTHQHTPGPGMSRFAGLLSIDTPPSDLSPEQIEENKRLVAERLERERAESAMYLSGEKTLGPAWVNDEDVETVGSGQYELPRHEQEQIAAAAEQVEEIDGTVTRPETLAPDSE